MASIDMALFDKLDADCQRMIVDMAVHEAVVQERRAAFKKNVLKELAYRVKVLRGNHVVHVTTPRAVEATVQYHLRKWQRVKSYFDNDENDHFDWDANDGRVSYYILHRVTNNELLQAYETEQFAVDGVNWCCVYD